MSTENKKWVLFEGEKKEWNNLVFDSKGGCYQSYEWGEYKKQMGWIPFRIMRLDYDVVYVVQVLAKKYWKFSLMFIPGLGGTKYLDEQFFEFIRQLVGVNYVYLRCSFPIEYDKKKYDLLINNKWRAPL